MGHYWFRDTRGELLSIHHKQLRSDIAGTEQLSNAQYSLTAREVEAIVNAAKSPRDRTLIRLFVETGIRRFEAANLEQRDLDLSSRILMVRNGKGNKARRIPLTSEIVSELASLRDNTKYIFGSSRPGPLSLRQINRIVADAAKAAGVSHPNQSRKYVTCHLLRHTFARLWKASGGSIESLSAILGHASVKTTWDTYGKESLGDIQHNYNTTISRMYSRKVQSLDKPQITKRRRNE